MTRPGDRNDVTGAPAGASAITRNVHIVLLFEVSARNVLVCFFRLIIRRTFHIQTKICNLLTTPIYAIGPNKSYVIF